MACVSNYPHSNFAFDFICFFFAWLLFSSYAFVLLQTLIIDVIYFYELRKNEINCNCRFVKFDWTWQLFRDIHEFSLKPKVNAGLQQTIIEYNLATHTWQKSRFSFINILSLFFGAVLYRRVLFHLLKPYGCKTGKSSCGDTWNQCNDRKEMPYPTESRHHFLVLHFIWKGSDW